VTVAALAFAAFLVVILATDPTYRPLWGVDRGIYREAGQRVLSGGSWFLERQLHGPYVIEVGDVMYPPVAMLWLVPAALLPDVLWSALPLLVIGAVVAWHRPGPWGIAGIALCLAYPWTPQMLASGNPGWWIAAAVAVGTVWRPAFALAFCKPSLLVVPFLGARDRRWWGLTAAGIAVSLAMLPLTVAWFHVILDGRGPFARLDYSVRDLGLVLIPLIAWRTRSRAPWLRASFRVRNRPVAA
jgi:hypothetical protein